MVNSLPSRIKQLVSEIIVLEAVLIGVKKLLQASFLIRPPTVDTFSEGEGLRTTSNQATTP